jgi:hypothetical protein
VVIFLDSGLRRNDDDGVRAGIFCLSRLENSK